MEEAVPHGLDPSVASREVAAEVDAVHLEKMLNRVTVREHTFSSDEGAALGGDDRHPYPLDYFAAGLAT